MMMNRILRLIRTYHDMNLSEASERIGLSKSYISGLEHGHKKASLDVLEKYSVAFNISMSSLMLFAERTGENKFSEKARVIAADKAMKILEWMETINADKKKNHVG